MSRFRSRFDESHGCLAALAGCAMPLLGFSIGQPAIAATEVLETVTVTATRLARPSFETPASIDRVEIRRDGYAINVADSLAGVAGLVARDRQNYAQDTQISVRGFGARSPFGIRGVRLYIDGIPATQPDGQGQVSHFNLATADRVEVLRGPFSALYGNSSGGVIQLFTRDGGKDSEIAIGAASGSAGTWRVNVGGSGEIGAAAFNAGATRFSTDGTRGHSAARRDSLQGKWTVPVGEAGRVAILGNYLNAPDAQDPLGLTQSQFAVDPQQAAPVALQFNTRKNVEQWQAGVVYDGTVTGDNPLRLMGYAGSRAVRQFLAIPVATQSDPRHSGGVVDLATRFGGGEIRYGGDFQLGNRRAAIVAGISFDSLSQQRLGMENFIGTALGVAGALRRDERNTVQAFDQYLQVDYALSDRASALAGLRHSRIRFLSRDRYVRTGNPDDSGAASYEATTPAMSMLFRAAPSINLYAAYGQGFETPTFAELAYRSDGNAGLNFNLMAASTRNYELGLKWRGAESSHLELAAFQSDTARELIVVVNAGGRSAYANAGRTRRTGVELTIAAPLSERWNVQASYAALKATVRDSYLTCSTVPCLAPATLVTAGNRIPGVPQTTAYAELRWRHPGGWSASVDGRHAGPVAVNDLNAATADAFTLLNGSIGYRWQTAGFGVDSFLRLENLLDRRHVGSVIVNDANGRFLEAGPGRTVRFGLETRLM